MSKKINLTYNQNENDKKIENGFYIAALYLFYIIKFFIKSLFLGYKIIFDFCIASKNLIYKTSKQEKVFLLAKLIISLLGIVNTILATIYYYTLLDKNISLLDKKYLLGLKYFLFIFLLGFVINFKNVLLDKISLAKQKIWKERFNKISFWDNNKQVPEVMEVENDEHCQKIYFESYIPLDEWKKRINYLQQIFNSELEIEPYEHNFTTKIVKLPKKKLDKLIYFDEKYFCKEDNKVCIGLDLFGIPVYIDFNQFPHGLISGDTGSGKSTLLKLIYVSLKRSGKLFILIDLKGTTLKLFKKYERKGIIYNDIDSVLEALQKAERIHDNRLIEINKYDHIEDIYQYNKAVENREIDGKIEQDIYILIDEIARITVDDPKNPKTIEIVRILTKLSQTGRSQGFHLIFITQRPDTDTLAPKIRAMLGVKVSGPFKEKYTAEMAINDRNAFENFPEVKGRMLILQDKTRQFQGFYINNSDLDVLLNEEIYIKNK